jgi:hypothetical protein
MMPLTILGLALAALAPAVAMSPDAPLAAFPGYGHPEIPANRCQVRDAAHVACTIPGRTAGRYAIVVRGVSTASGADPRQAMVIGGPGWTCGEVDVPAAGWSSGARTLTGECDINVISDAPVEVEVVFGGVNTTLDPHGPVVSIHPVRWSGVFTAPVFVAQAPKAGG